MKADKKKAKAEGSETKPKSKTDGKSKRKVDDAPQDKKKAKESTADQELKLLPDPKAKAAAKSSGTAKVAAKTSSGAQKTSGAKREPSQDDAIPRSKAGVKASSSESRQRPPSAEQAAAKTKVRSSGSSASKAASRASRQVQDDDAASGSVTGAQARAQEKERLKVKPSSAARARDAYAESDEDAYPEDEDSQESEESEVKERGLVQFRRTPKSDESSKKEPKVKKSTFIIGAACVAVLFAGFCMMNFAPKKGGFPGGPGFGEEMAQVTVRTTTAQIATLHDYVETNGEIECQSSVECYPDIGGKVAKVFVALGDRVWKGTALAEVDPNEPGTYFINSVVYAPISGMVTATPKEVGTTVTTTTSITTIGNVSRLQIRAKVPERYVSFLKIGLKADIILEAYPDETFTASVTKVSPVVDPDSRTKEILLRFDQSDSRINAGMFAKITLFTADYEGQIIVPSVAVVEKTGGKKNVYVLAGGAQSVSLREVETGKSVDNMIQILSGLTEGERVVTEGMTSLSDGAPVRDITGGLTQSALSTQGSGELPPSPAGSPPSGSPGAGGPPPGGQGGSAR